MAIDARIAGHAAVGVVAAGGAGLAARAPAPVTLPRAAVVILVAVLAFLVPAARVFVMGVARLKAQHAHQRAECGRRAVLHERATRELQRELLRWPVKSRRIHELPSSLWRDGEAALMGGDPVLGNPGANFILHTEIDVVDGDPLQERALAGCAAM